MANKSEEKARLKELALELREVWEDHRLSRRSSKFDTYFKTILNEDLYPSFRKKLLKNLAEYQYLVGKCKGSDVFEKNHERGDK